MLRKVASALAFSAIIATPALAEDVTVDTATGPVAVAANPETIVVYDMAALDTLDALGVPVASSVAPIYVDYLKQYEGDAGTLFEPDIEAIHALSPDLIVAGGRSASQVEALSKVAPTIDMTIWGEDMEGQTLARLDAYGAIFGKAVEAEALEARLEAEVAKAKEAVAGKGNGLIILTNGPKISAYGADSRFGWIHDAIGLPEAVPNLEDVTHGEAVSFEFLKEVNPDWLLVIDRVAAINGEGDSAQATLDNPLVAETTAWKNGQVVYLNAADIYIAGGGIQSMMNTLAILEEAFSGANS